MADHYAMRLFGGPMPGVRTVPSAVGWPLPERLDGRGVPVPDGEHDYSATPGVYVKIAESQLPPGVDDNPHVMRGAAYEWRDGR